MTAKIIDHAINLVPGTGDAVELNLGFDVVFTGNDLSAGQSGAAKYELVCGLWDDDSLSNDHITTDIHHIEPQSIQQVTGVEMPFVLSRNELEDKEPPGEGTIEVFGEFFLKRNGRRLGPRDKTKNVDIELPS